MFACSPPFLRVHLSCLEPSCPGGHGFACRALVLLARSRRDRRMAHSSRGGQSSSRIAAFFREPARMRPKTFPCYQNASHASCNTYRALACFLITTLFVFRFLPRPTTPGADASAHKNVRSVAPNAPASDGEPLRQHYSSKGSRPKATAFAFLRLDKIPEACIATTIGVFVSGEGVVTAKEHRLE